MVGAVKILVASMSGTAEMVAEEVADALQSAGFATSISLMHEVRIADITPGVYVICTSTYGKGEVPDNAKLLFAGLGSDKPDLGGVLFGVVGLGDSVYPNTFCFGGKRFDELLQSLGAERVGDRLDHDSRSQTYPEEAAREWAAEWAKQLAKRVAP